MAGELSCRLVVPSAARNVGTGTDPKQATGLFYGTQAAEPYSVPEDTSVWYDPGTGQTSDLLQAGTLALIWQGTQASTDSAGLVALNNLTTWYRLFTIPGTNNLYAARQQDYPAIVAALTVIPIWTVQGRIWKRSQFLKSGTVGPPPPPPPPPVVINSDGSGKFFEISNGSNPSTIHAGFAAGTKTLSMILPGVSGGWTNLARQNTTPDGGSRPEYPAHGEFPYPLPIEWMLPNFKPHADAGDHWPLPGSYADSAYGPISGRENSLPYATFWPKWQDPAFGLTNWEGQYAATAIWDRNPSQALLLFLSGDGTGGGRPAANTYPTHTSERILIRGNVPLPVLPARAVVLHCTWNSVVNNHFTPSSVFLNGHHDGFVQPGSPSGNDYGSALVPQPHVYTYDDTVAAGYWNFGGDNLVAMVCDADLDAFGKWNGTAWIDIVFLVDYGTGGYLPPPDGWQLTHFDDTSWVPGTAGDVGGFFDRGVAHSTTFGTQVVLSRYYGRFGFTIPRGSYSSCTLAITARTGIGQIYINDHLLVTLDETTNLWSAGTVLTYTIPIAWLNISAGGDLQNTMAVFAYTADGNTAIDYQITLVRA